MEHSLREKAKASLVIQHSYQAIAKHNQVSECSGCAEDQGPLGPSGG